MDYITGNRNFLEQDAIYAADHEADRATSHAWSMWRVCCSWCGSADGWEQWDRWQVETLLRGLPLPTFYRHDDDAEHLYVPCWRCKPSVDGAVAMSAKAVQEWLGLNNEHI